MRLNISAFIPSEFLGGPTAFRNYIGIHIGQAIVSKS